MFEPETKLKKIENKDVTKLGVFGQAVFFVYWYTPRTIKVQLFIYVFDFENFVIY